MTGLTLVLPAPSPPTKPLSDHLKERGPVQSVSLHTGMTYALDLSAVLAIRQFTRKTDPERTLRAVARALRHGSNASEDDSKEHDSSPASAASPSGPSIGATTKYPIH